LDKNYKIVGGHTGITKHWLRGFNFTPKSEIQTGKMTQSLGAETNRKNRGIPKVVCRDFFNSFMLQEIVSSCRFQFRISGLKAVVKQSQSSLPSNRPASIRAVPRFGAGCIRRAGARRWPFALFVR
jgi:hypothetical protein